MYKKAITVLLYRKSRTTAEGMLPSFGIADMVSAKRLWFSPKLSNNHNNDDGVTVLMLIDCFWSLIVVNEGSEGSFQTSFETGPGVWSIQCSDSDSSIWSWLSFYGPILRSVCCLLCILLKAFPLSYRHRSAIVVATVGPRLHSERFTALELQSVGLRIRGCIIAYSSSAWFSLPISMLIPSVVDTDYMFRYLF